MRSTALLLPLLLLCACSSLSSEEQGLLASYQQRALTFFEGNRMNQAWGQIEKGLELAPDDYKLNALKGCVLLRQSGDATSTDHRMLDEATALLTQVYGERSPSRHEPYLLLNYGLALQKQGRRHLGESIRLNGQATRTPEPLVAAGLREQADGEIGQAKALLDQAASQFDVLIERGELPRIAHNHRMQIARDQGDDERFVKEAGEYLKHCRLAQDVTKKRIDETPSVPYELEQMQWLEKLQAEELEVRGLIAQFHYERKNFQPALEQLNRVLELDPRRFPDYYNRGRVLLELGRLENAQADMRKFLADPTLPSTSDKATFAVKVLGK